MPAQTPQCLLAFYTISLALGDKPTLSANSAEDAALDDLLAETLQQLILAFIRSQNYACHFLTPSRMHKSPGNFRNGLYCNVPMTSCQWDKLHFRTGIEAFNQKRPALCRSFQAERGGFEPPIEYYPNNHLAGGPVQPLRHLPEQNLL